MITIMLKKKKTHNGTRQKQWHNRLWRDTRGFRIGFPFDRERKHLKCGDTEGGRQRGGTRERKCRWHTDQINDITVQSSAAFTGKWGHSGQDLLLWQQQTVSLPTICVLMYRQALSQQSPCLESTFKSHDLSERCSAADVFPIQHGELKFTLCISRCWWALLTKKHNYNKVAAHGKDFPKFILYSAINFVLMNLILHVDPHEEAES